MTKLSFLTSLGFGVHSPRRCPYRALLSDHENKRFVVIVLREEPQQVDGRLGKAVQQVVNKVWDKNNPFSWGEDSPAYRVVALEVEWSSIVGIDYRCPLHDDGKLVLEARQVVKRCFKTVEDARDFYSPLTTTEVHCGALRTSLSAAPTPSKVSFDGRQPGLSAMTSVQGGLALPLSPRFSRSVSCASSASAAAVLRPAGSCGFQGADRSLISSLGTAGEWLPSGWGGRRRSMDRGAPRSVSATRVLRARALPGNVGSAVEFRAAAFAAPSSSCMDFASADEGERATRHRRASVAVSAGAVAPGTVGAAGGAARRRLEMRAVDSVPVLDAAAAALESMRAGPDQWPQKHLDGSPRKARSVNDLCGMALAHGRQREQAGGPATAVATCFLTQSAECVANVSAACAAPPARWRNSDSMEYGSSRCSRSRGGAGGPTVGCSGSVDSFRAAFLLQQQQRQQQDGEHLRWRGRRAHARHGHVSSNKLANGRGDEAGGEARGSGGRVPRASRWTQPSATYYSKTLVLGFRDPFLPQELRRFVKSDMRLLKMYESGLPSWAVFMPCYGLPYRPWLRRALWLLFIAISIFSMGCGFYDLYKNVPFLKQVVTAVASRMYLPASELFEWLEHHTQIRMSILLTYLFSKSPLLVSLMRMLRSLAALLQQLLRPALATLSAAARPLLEALRLAGASVGGSVLAAGAAVWHAAEPLVSAAAVSGREIFGFTAAVLGPPARAVWAVAVLLAQLVRLVAALVGMVLVGPLQLACSVGGVLSWAGAELAERLAVVAATVEAGLRWLLTLGRAARRAAPAVKAGARLAAQAAGSVSGGVSGGGVSGGMAVWQWLGLEVVGAYNAVRLTFVQAFKSAKAVVNFCMTVAQTAVQHRVSLLLQLRRFITRQKERLPPVVAASVPLPSFVSMSSFTSAPPYDVALPGPDPETDLDAEPALVTGLATTPTEHSLYDMDMVLGSSDDDSHLLVPESQHLYGGNNGMVGARRDGGGRGPAKPVPIPLGGRGSGLRRRHLGGAPPSRLGLAGVSSSSSLGYGLYDVLRQRLDAVDEEDSQQVSDGHSSGPEAGSGRVQADADAAYFPLDRARMVVGMDTTEDPWPSSGGMRSSCGVDLNADDGDFLSYASAPASSNAVQGEAEVFAGFGLQLSFCSPSRRRGRGLEASALSRSVPSAQFQGRPPARVQQPAPNRKQKQQQQQLNNPGQRQEQQRHLSATLEGSGSSPSDVAAAEGSGRSCGPRRRPERGGNGGLGAVPPALKAGAGALGASIRDSGASRAAPASAHGPGADALTCSSPFMRGLEDARKCNGSSQVPTGTASPVAGSNEAGASEGIKAAAASKEHDPNKGRGGGAGGANNACGKRHVVGGKHVSRPPAIQAA